LVWFLARRGGAKPVKTDDPLVKGPVTGRSRFNVGDAFDGVNKILCGQFTPFPFGKTGVVLKVNAAATGSLQIGVLQKTFVDFSDSQR